MYTCFHPFGLMSEHLAEGVYFQSHIRITLQINNEFSVLVSLLRQVAACCADWHHSAHLRLCQTRIYHPNFAPERQVRSRWRSRSLKGIPPIRPEADFYVHLNIARYVFSRSKYFEHPGKRLAAGGGLPLRSREAFQPAVSVPRSQRLMSVKPA